MRRIVGTFLEHDNQFAILRRHSDKPNGDTWGLPAGKAEPHETGTEAAARELSEETGYKATVDELEYLGTYLFGEGDKRYQFAAFRAAVLVRPLITMETAHTDVRWVSGPECYALPDLIPDFHELLIRTGYAAAPQIQ